ncbi:MAG: dTMP kinase [Candidatus Lokiarchaeota archaeon]|nr:dTMP kinase [Candidatus Lokiarchaeota archaeon]
MDDQGVFIVIDGIDGCGSTTQTAKLGAKLIECGIKVHLTHEPSKLPVGNLLREYLQNETAPIATDALLFAADRVEHYYYEILPKLEEGYVVVSDRYLEASIAYQTAQGKLEEKIENSPFKHMDINWVLAINQFAPQPDLTFIIDIDPRVSLARKNPTLALEKFETVNFLDSVRKIYLERAQSQKHIIVDGAKSVKEIANTIYDCVVSIISAGD